MFDSCFVIDEAFESSCIFEEETEMNSAMAKDKHRSTTDKARAISLQR